GRGRAVDWSSLERGRAAYARQCSVCHGASGSGNGLAAPSLLPPPSDLTLHVRWHSDAQLLWLIAHGVAGTSMVGFADRLDSRDRRDVIAYLRTLIPAPTASLARQALTGPPTAASTPVESRAAAPRASPTTPPPKVQAPE